jgi:hypothetical protein
VHCLTPVITLEKMQRGKRAMVSEPLFPNYLFVEFDPEVIHTTTISATRRQPLCAFWRAPGNSSVNGHSPAFGLPAT